MKRHLSGFLSTCSFILFVGANFPLSCKAQSTYLQSTGTVTQTTQTYNSTTADLSAVKVTGGTLTLSNSSISSSGNSSSTDNSSFYGLNAVILAYTSSGTAVINSSGNTVTSSGIGANGIFAYGTASITTTGDKFTHTGSGGHAIMCSGGGTIIVKNDTAVTSGGSSSTIATDRGSGTITINGGSYTANGSNSAAIYSTGIITGTDATFVATGAEALVTEGSNKIILNNCKVKCTYNKWGALLYQSMSGDASGVDGYITMNGGSFTYTGTKGGLFYNTNATAFITLNGVTLVNSCDTLVRCIKGSWGGSTASSGGITNLTAIAQTMAGLIHIDASSKAYVNLSEASVYTGAINASNTAALASLTMDATSTWTLTANSYLNIISNSAGISGTTCTNITGNGFNVYYDSSVSDNSYLNSKTYTLVGGGYLLPLSGSTTTGIESITQSSDLLLLEQYPNPVSSYSTILYTVPLRNRVSLTIYNQSGQVVDVLVNELKEIGKYTITWTPSLANGTYFCQLLSGSKMVTKKIVIAK